MLKLPFSLSEKLVGGLILWTAAILVYFAYMPGLNGVAYYDDFANFDGLAMVSDASSALLFVFGGESGPLGRPLSLASFLLNVGDWPNYIAGVLRINVLIHILNGLLVAWLLFRIIRLTDPQIQEHGLAITVSASALWMVLPLLVSTTLIPVQRMASLSATFVLVGLIFYVIGLDLTLNSRRIGLLLQAIALVIGTTLAVLAKENGILLPVFALVLETTLLAPGKRPQANRWLRLTFLGTATFTIIAYLIIHIPDYSAAADAGRDFTLWQRVITQPLILWDYLWLAFFPRITAFSPYHQTYPYIESLGAAPWAALIALAWVLLAIQAVRWRNTHPVFAFAILWFLAAHLLESTVVPLELYFEHRNYLALLGPCFALATVGWSGRRSFGWLPPAGLLIYLLLMLVILWQTTSLWGDRLVAAEIWYRENPTSSRAAQNLAEIYANEIGDVDTAQKIIDRISTAGCTDCPDLAWQGLQLACVRESPENIQARVKALLDRAPATKKYRIVAVALVEIQKLMAANRCNSLTLNDFEKLNKTLLDNVGLRRYVVPHQVIHYNLAQVHRIRHDLNGYLLELEQAWQIQPTLILTREIVVTFVSAGLFDDARRFIKKARQQVSNNPIIRDIWLANLDQLEAYIENNRVTISRNKVSPCFLPVA